MSGYASWFLPLIQPWHKPGDIRHWTTCPKNSFERKLMTQNWTFGLLKCLMYELCTLKPQFHKEKMYAKLAIECVWAYFPNQGSHNLHHVFSPGMLSHHHILTLHTFDKTLQCYIPLFPTLMFNILSNSCGIDCYSGHLLNLFSPLVTCSFVLPVLHWDTDGDTEEKYGYFGWDKVVG